MATPSRTCAVPIRAKREQLKTNFRDRFVKSTPKTGCDDLVCAEFGVGKGPTEEAKAKIWHRLSYVCHAMLARTSRGTWPQPRRRARALPPFERRGNNSKGFQDFRTKMG